MFPPTFTNQHTFTDFHWLPRTYISIFTDFHWLPSLPNPLPSIFTQTSMAIHDLPCRLPRKRQISARGSFDHAVRWRLPGENMERSRTIVDPDEGENEQWQKGRHRKTVSSIQQHWRAFATNNIPGPQSSPKIHPNPIIRNSPNIRTVFHTSCTYSVYQTLYEYILTSLLLVSSSW